MKRIAALLALFFVAGAQAAITVDVGTDSIMVEPNGSASIPFTVTGDCMNAPTSLADIIAGTGSVEVPITASGGEGLTFTETTATLDYSTCITGLAGGGLEAPSATGTITVTADQWSPGRIDQPVTLTEGENTALANVMVNYTNLFSFSTDATFPMETDGGMASFNATVSVTTNARTMVMFFDREAACGKISGVPPVTNINDGEFTPGVPVEFTFQVDYEATCDGLEDDMHKFYVLAHFQDKQFGDETEHDYTWNFMNKGGHTADDLENEDTPGFSLAIALVGLVGIAFVARRK